MQPILPGSTIGILGSGQLGRMLALVARRMGYDVVVYSPTKLSPAGQVADEEFLGAYDDVDRVKKFAKKADVVTFEFENIGVEAAAAVEKLTPTRPAPGVLHTTQHRLREKTFLRQEGFPCAEFREVNSVPELEAALDALGLPCVLKTAGFGYDGKGQAKITAREEAASAYAEVGGGQCVLEAWIAFEREVSMVAARGVDGSFVHYGLFENQHTNHILDVTMTNLMNSARAEEITRGIFEKLGIVGTACVEFFSLPGGELLVNEIAPRPHNSGHLTIEACVASQFEQQLRAVCALPLGNPQFLAPAAMANLLGEHLENPDYDALLRFPDVRLHLYGKQENAVGRKMGHVTALGRSGAHALGLVRAARQAIMKLK
ncbi:MAG: 5-(carboxyamino)imidazole ribonucleotide synthase [Bryobacter sp.]